MWQPSATAPSIFLGQRRHVGRTTTIDHGDAFRSQTDGRASGVHRDVAAADDAHVHSLPVGKLARCHLAQHLDRRYDACGVFALDADALVAVRADRDVQRIVIASHVLDRQVDAHVDAVDDFHARRLDRRDFGIEDVFGETVVGNAVAQHAARLLEAFEHRDVVAETRQVVGRRKAGRARTRHGDLLARGLEARCGARPRLMIDGIALHAPDVDRIVDQRAATSLLARMLADVGARRRKRVVFPDQFDRIIEATRGRQRDIARNVDVRRTRHRAWHALRRAAQAASMLHMLFEIVMERRKAHEHLLGRLVADSAIGRIPDMLGKRTQARKRTRIRFAVDDVFQHARNARKPDTARNALPAALRMRNAHLGARHIDRTCPPRGRAETPRRIVALRGEPSMKRCPRVPLRNAHASPPDKTP